MKKEYFKLALDQSSNAIIHIDNVEEKYKGAICPQCKAQLIASNGKPRKSTTYFRHKNDSHCRGESVLHQIAKIIVAEEKKLTTPREDIVVTQLDLNNMKHVDSAALAPKGLKFISPEVEKKIKLDSSYLIADAFGIEEDTNQPIAIEIYKSNKVKNEKLQKFVSLQLNALEINISKVEDKNLQSLKAFTKYVLHDAPREWLFSNEKEQLKTELEKSLGNYVKFVNSEIRKQRAAVERQMKLEAEEYEKILEKENRVLQLENERIERWRFHNKDFIQLIHNASHAKNKEKLEAIYEERLINGAHKNYYQWFQRYYGGIPLLFYKKIKGDLGIKQHRSLWQYYVFKITVIEPYLKSISDFKRRGEPITTKRWSMLAEKWSPFTIYRRLNLPLREVCKQSEQLEGKLIFSSYEIPESHLGLKKWEWNELPKPIIILKEYLEILVDKGFLSRFKNGLYHVKMDADIEPYLL